MTCIEQNETGNSQCSEFMYYFQAARILKVEYLYRTVLSDSGKNRKDIHVISDYKCGANCCLLCTLLSIC